VSNFLLSCGGTGGHLSPGIALAEGLLQRGHSVTLLISRKRVDGRLIEKYPQLHFERIPGSGFGWNPIVLGRFIVSQSSGLWACARLIRKLRPRCILGFGGFTSASVVLAGRLFRVPVALHEANRVPGRAVRVLGRISRRVYLPPGVSLPSLASDSIRYVGLPVRKEIHAIPQSEAREALGLLPEGRVLAILGGSQGASPLNDWLRRELDALLDAGIQVYCVTGLGKDIPETIERNSPAGVRVRAIFAPFCDRMAELISAADLVVSRSGAGTLSELIRCQVPSVLVPFPQAADDHQRANASWLAVKGGAVVIEQPFLASLRAEVCELLGNASQLAKMREALRQLDEADSFGLMLDDLEAIAAGRKDEHMSEEDKEEALAS
jgi:UDP-N-acetylglucosamine--N-acetylmuramyl-(pentapeptide) pyrophosphoryl-undecaprenol N-acetylglucosamine transferase